LRTGVDDPKFYSLSDQANDDFIVLNALLDASVKVKADRESGTLSFPAGPEADAVIDTILPTVSSRLIGHATDPAPRSSSSLRRGRIGVYQPWIPNMDEGWTRLVLEKFRVPFVTLHNAEIRAGELNGKIDTLVLPSIEPRTLAGGYSENQ